jgi:hypothetical protein
LKVWTGSTTDVLTFTFGAIPYDQLVGEELARRNARTCGEDKHEFGGMLTRSHCVCTLVYTLPFLLYQRLLPPTMLSLPTELQEYIFDILSQKPEGTQSTRACLTLCKSISVRANHLWASAAGRSYETRDHSGAKPLPACPHKEPSEPVKTFETAGI